MRPFQLLMIVPLLLMRSMSIVGGQELIRGINYYGLETPSGDFVCGWQHRPSYYLDHLHEMGFNSIRLPFSLEYVRQDDFTKMDEFFDALAVYPSMNVTLDMHRVFSSHQGPTPTENWVTMTMFLDGWKKVARRYVDRPQLYGIDIFNEYQGTDSGYWNDVTHTIVKEMEKTFPGRFHYFVGGIRWGGDIHDMNLEDLDFADRIHYTIHKYIFSTAGYNREDDWNFSFGPFKNVSGKVSVGEWGFKSERGDEVQWAKEFVSYLCKIGVRDTYFWTIAHSGDTGGLWHDDCETIETMKLEIIKSLWSNNATQLHETTSSSIIPTTTTPTIPKLIPWNLRREERGHGL